jgi:hypothetical protein
MKSQTILAGATIALFCATSQAASFKLSKIDEASAFKAAGFSHEQRRWKKCDDPSPSYTPGAISEVLDANGDGLPDAIITEGGTACYGNTGTGYSLVSKQADGNWKLMSEDIGIPTLLSTRGVAGWPDIEIGGPGFCFPVVRWNGKRYAPHRQQYEGKPCRRQ